MFPRFVIGLILPLLLPTPAIWFSLDHKQNVSDGVVSGIRTLFSLDHKLYAFDDDCYSVARKTNLLASPCRYSLLLSLVEGEKRRLCLNRVKPLTSQSCFLSSNWFFECEHPFIDRTKVITSPLYQAHGY